ncbi:uncharacterized protein N7511_000188 [Penicillium nucicola]|uniref:uncharacterized protein n=1 Tax=Penicillium nucicola TaxID=1850975 RepID=UPI0025453B63|nr:uncharacterized protein N7511_000188 [Penicillium nucicola]KAJ5775177.1 hypothetical protein N7511_000188 [Penicillium nucicola]
MSRHPEHSIFQPSLTRSDRLDAPSSGQESPDLSPESSLEIQDTIPSLQARRLLEPGEISARAEMAAIPSHASLGFKSDTAATAQSVEPESFEVPIMLDDPTYCAVPRPVTPTGPRLIRVPMSTNPLSVPLPESPDSASVPLPESLVPTYTLPAATFNANQTSLPRGALFAAQFGRPDLASTQVSWPEDAVPYSTERMFEAWLIRQQLLVGIPIDQLQPMTNPTPDSTFRTPPWIIITPDGAYIRAVPPARFRGVMQPMPRVPWLTPLSTELNQPADFHSSAARSPASLTVMADDVSTNPTTSILLDVIDSALERSPNLIPLLEMSQQLATVDLADSAVTDDMNLQETPVPLAALSTPTTHPRLGATEGDVRSPNPSAPLTSNPTLAAQSILSGLSAARNLRSVRSQAPSPELPVPSVPGVVGPRMTLRTTPVSSNARDLPRPEGLHAPALVPVVSSVPFFTILEPRLAASRPPRFHLTPSRDPRPEMNRCRLANVAIFSGSLYAYPPRPRRPRPVPMYRWHRPSRRPVEGSATDGDIPLRVTRVDPIDPDTLNRETPFGGGDGSCARFSTFDALDNKIGKDDVLPNAENAKAAEQQNTSQIKWHRQEPLLNRFSTNLYRMVTWNIEHAPMEPLFQGALLDDLGIKLNFVNGIFCRLCDFLTPMVHKRTWPERTVRMLFKLWDLMKLPDNYYRLWILQNRKLWPDKDLSLDKECIPEIDIVLKDLHCNTTFDSILTTACFTMHDMSMVLWFLNGNAPATRLEMRIFLFQLQETDRNPREDELSPHRLGWYRWEESIPVADPWTAQEARSLLSRQIYFVMYPIYYPAKYADLNLGSSPASPAQRWGLIPVNILVMDEFLRRKLNDLSTMEQCGDLEENDDLSWTEEMHEFLNEQRSLHMQMSRD